MVNITYHFHLINKDNTVINLIAELENGIQTFLTFTIVLVNNTLKTNMSTLHSTDSHYTKMILLS